MCRWGDRGTRALLCSYLAFWFQESFGLRGFFRAAWPVSRGKVATSVPICWQSLFRGLKIQFLPPKIVVRGYCILASDGVFTRKRRGTARTQEDSRAHSRGSVVPPNPHALFHRRPSPFPSPPPTCPLDHRALNNLTATCSTRNGTHEPNAPTNSIADRELSRNHSIIECDDTRSRCTSRSSSSASRSGGRVGAGQESDESEQSSGGELSRDHSTEHSDSAAGRGRSEFYLCDVGSTNGTYIQVR